MECNFCVQGMDPRNISSKAQEQASEVSHPGVSKSFLGHGKMGKMGEMGGNGGKWGKTGGNGGKRGGNGGKCGGYFFDDTHDCNTSSR